jgi:hypothetical protein
MVYKVYIKTSIKLAMSAPLSCIAQCNAILFSGKAQK